MLFGDCVKYKNDLYAFAINENILVKFDRDTKQAEAIGTIPEENTNSRWLVSKMLIYNDSILFVPCNASNIWILDMIKKQWIKVELQKSNLDYKFATGFIYEKKAYLIGSQFDGIVVYDFEQEQLTYHYDAYEFWRENEKKDIYCRDYTFLDNQTIVLAPCNSNKIIEINLKNMGVKAISVGERENRYESIERVGDTLWLTPRTGKNLLIYDLRKSYKMVELNMGDKQNICHYCGMKKVEDTVRIFACADAASYNFSSNGKKVNEVDERYTFLHEEKEYFTYQTLSEQLNIVGKNYTEKIDTKNIEIKGLFLIKKAQTYCEDGNYTLARFIDAIALDKN